MGIVWISVPAHDQTNRFNAVAVIGLTLTLADITEEEFRVLELIESERQGQIHSGRDGNKTSFQFAR
jgi:hypothetical protein